MVDARAWCNNEVAYVAWRPLARIEGLLGFMIVRVHADGKHRLLPAWVAFDGQHNPRWGLQDTGVWPVQKFSWRDLTLRRSRDGIDVRRDFSCHYEIYPVGHDADGRESVADWRARAKPSPTLPPKPYTGSDVPLYICGAPYVTNQINVGTQCDGFEVAFTNGILSTQNLRVQLHVLKGKKPSKALLREHTGKPDDPVRKFLTGDVLPTIKGFLADVAPDEELYAALYELTDVELRASLAGLGSKLHLILSTAGSPGKNDSEWDGENEPARTELKQTAAEVVDRMFNNADRIGHNKFAVIVAADGKPRKVLTGSTNWTDTGLCTQSNNTIVSDAPALAQAYFDYWTRLKADTQSWPPLASITAPNRSVQQQPLRTADRAAYPAEDVSARLWCSPNTVATSKTSKSPTPADLTDVFALMRSAKHAILFLTFLPSVEGAQSIIDAAVQLGREDPDLLVLGAISSPMAMPNYVKSPKVPGTGESIPPPAIFSPEDAPRVLTVRAAAVEEEFGDFEPELLSAGFAIIHDKIVVIDPFSDDCVVVTGSHNLGYKASYCNDDNLLIIERAKAVAQAYAVHVLDIYEHYRFRAVLEERRRDRLLAGEARTASGAAAAGYSGFLSTKDGWQDDWLDGRKGAELGYFLQ